MTTIRRVKLSSGGDRFGRLGGERGAEAGEDLGAEEEGAGDPGSAGQEDQGAEEDLSEGGGEETHAALQPSVLGMPGRAGRPSEHQHTLKQIPSSMLSDSVEPLFQTML